MKFSKNSNEPIDQVDHGLKSILNNTNYLKIILVRLILFRSILLHSIIFYKEWLENSVDSVRVADYSNDKPILTGSVRSMRQSVFVGIPSQITVGIFGHQFSDVH